MSKEKISRYIQNEKDVSRYQISIFEKSKNNNPAKRRLLDIEKEFVNLPLETIDFEDVADVAAAISIYRSSRVLFYETYKISPPKIDGINKNVIFDHLNKKIDFLKQQAFEFMNSKVEELNLVQNSDFYYDLAKNQALKNGTTIDLEKRKLDNMDLNSLLKIEPITLSKKRARAQAIVFSIGKYLEDRCNEISLNKNLNIEELYYYEDKINLIIKDLKLNIFKNYNKALKFLPIKLDGTMGENTYISKLHELQNLMYFNQYEKGDLKISYPRIENIFLDNKKIINYSLNKDSERKIQNKVFGILFPIPRKGNEKMSLLYKSIFIDDIDVSHLFSNNFSNVKINIDNKEVYYKALLLEPFWKIIELANTEKSARFLISKIMNIAENDFLEIDFNNKNIISKINNFKNKYINISDNSVILSAKTRSEEEGISDVYSIIYTKISEIYEDFSKLTMPTNE